MKIGIVDDNIGQKIVRFAVPRDGRFVEYSVDYGGEELRKKGLIRQKIAIIERIHGQVQWRNG